MSAYTGKTKLEFCDRLGSDWRRLAMILDIADSDQQTFEKGGEARAIWVRLDNRRELGKLPEALQFIGRKDLADLLEPEPAATPPASARWPGCPYPGLMSFKPNEAAIFFGRKRETRELAERIRQPDIGFVAVVGASGSGKSSLVRAGLIPKLQDSGRWVWARLTPGELGDDPFQALAAALKPLLQGGDDSVSEIRERLVTRADVAGLVGEVRAARRDTQVLVFIDQFEELITLAAEPHRLPFCILLKRMADVPGLSTVVTLRADFYVQCLAYPPLTELLRRSQTSFPLDAPDTPARLEMIRGPAAAAGLNFDDGLVGRILADTGNEPGTLALMAFALHELYRASQPGTQLTGAAYDSFGGVKGAIGTRAEARFDDLDEDSRQAFAVVFKELVDVDPERGLPTRKRAPLHRFEPGSPGRRLIDRFVAERLLVCGERVDPQVEVAHEALLSHWPRLERWVGERFDDFRLLRQVRGEAAEWGRLGRPASHLWPEERLKPVQDMLSRLAPSLTELERNFVRSEAERLLDEIADPSTSHERRAWIGDRLAEIGDPRFGIGLDEAGLPAFAWVPIAGGIVTLEGDAGTYTVEPFSISRYPVTWRQYRAFVDAADGYRSDRWWEALRQDAEPGTQYRRKENHPAENVSWYDAAAYCRWLSVQFGFEIRLPTEWEWQQAATGGQPDYEFPWGQDWDSGRANTWESGLGRSTAVGLYPQGTSPDGLFDMAGNVWEWCANEYENPERTDSGVDQARMVRGGSWLDSQDSARAAYRSYGDPGLRYYHLGLRVVCRSPIAGTSTRAYGKLP